MMKSFLFLSLFITSATAWAFPEFVRHGYFSCTACHVSTNGGGMLTEYGRELSRELVSTWGTEKESQFAYGLAELPEWLGVGGDVRWLQVQQSNEAGDRGLFFNMQADLEVALFFGRMSVVGTVGRKARVSGNADEAMISRKHYVALGIGDSLSVRGGRFYPEYGIYDPNHRRFVRQFFGFNQEEETYNGELAYMAEKFNIFLTGIFGRPDTDEESEQRDSGVAATFNYFLAEKHRLGASYKYGVLDDVTRHQFAVFGLLGFTKRVFLAAELGLKSTESLSSPEANANAIADMVKLSAEVFKGFNLYAVHEFYNPDIEAGENTQTVYGAGIQWFPRPHWEFSFEYQLKELPAVFADYEKNMLFLGHFYL